MMKIVLFFKLGREALAQQIGPSFCVGKMPPVALPFISIQVVLIELALDVVVPVVLKLVEGFVHRKPWHLAEIYICSGWQVTSKCDPESYSAGHP